MPPYIPSVGVYQRVADFETCFEVGSAAEEGASLTFDCAPVKGKEGIVVKLDFETDNAWAAFWIRLNDADFSSYDTLTFFAKGDHPEESVPVFKVELKRQDNAQIGITHLTGLTDEWKQFTVPFEEFRRFGDMPILCGWDAMSELVFTFESDRSGPRGTVYLDDIYLERRGEGAPTPAAECIPTPPPVLPPSPIVADFDSCTGVNRLGGLMGAAYNALDSLEETYVREPERGCVARLEYQIEEWSAFWIKLQGVDLSLYSQLVFDIRADPEAGVPGQIKVELKRANNREVSIIYISDITAEWQTVTVNLRDFGPTGYTAQLSSLTAMEEVVFTFEAKQSGATGVVYLDNVGFKP